MEVLYIMLMNIALISNIWIICSTSNLGSLLKYTELYHALIIQVNSHKTDSVGPGKLVRHMQNPSYAYDGQSIKAVY